MTDPAAAPGRHGPPGSVSAETVTRSPPTLAAATAGGLFLPVRALGFVPGTTNDGARGFLLVGGVVHLVLWVYGLVVDLEGPLNVVPLDTADSRLYLALGVPMIGLGAALSRATGTGDGAGIHRTRGRAA